MADQKRTPRARVDSGAPGDVIEAEARVIGEEGAAGGKGDDGKRGAAAGDPAGTGGQAFKDAGRRVSGWVGRTLPGHEHAFWGGVLGFVIGVLLFWVGPVKTLVVAVLALAGVAVGQAADGDPKIINFLRQFFSSNS